MHRRGIRLCRTSMPSATEDSSTDPPVTATRNGPSQRRSLPRCLPRLGISTSLSMMSQGRRLASLTASERAPSDDDAVGPSSSPSSKRTAHRPNDDDGVDDDDDDGAAVPLGLYRHSTPTRPLYCRALSLCKPCTSTRRPTANHRGRGRGCCAASALATSAASATACARS
jgi:hypothetical protein